MFSDQLSSGWGKAAAGAAVLVAGVGARRRRAPRQRAGVAARARPARCTSSRPRRRRRPRRPRPRRPSARAGTRDAGDSGGGVEVVRAQAATRARRRLQAKSKLGGRAHRPPPTGPRRPAAARCRRAPVRIPSRRELVERQRPAAVEAEGQDAEPGASKFAAAAVTPPPAHAGHRHVKPVTGAVNDTVNKTTDAVGGAVGGVGQAVDDTVAGVTGGGPVADTVDQVTDTVDDTVGTVTETVDDTVGGLTGALGGGHGG